MELTKYEHACFTLAKDNQVLVVDPGGWTTDFTAPDHVIAVVITHEHADHFDTELIAAILDKNPEAIIVAPESVTKHIEAFPTRTVSAGDTAAFGAFALRFIGGTHATIHPSMPSITNLGVIINELIYHPGDSFALPDQAVDTLALPVSAPWLKISETIDFLTTVKPRFTFPAHDAILSSAGKELADRLVGSYAKNVGTEYRRIDGEIITI